MNPQLVAERVARGAAYLDTWAPGWHRRINLDTLDLASKHNCVCGQVFGHYDKTPAVRDLLSGREQTISTHTDDSGSEWGHWLINPDFWARENAVNKWGTDHGFALRFELFGADNDPWGELRLAWEREILTRRDIDTTLQGAVADAVLTA